MVAILSSRALGVLAVRHAQALGGLAYERAILNAICADYAVEPGRVQRAIQLEVLAGRLVRHRDSDGATTLHVPATRAEAA